tara:strand:- start:77 stop:577 length:501 start_codon:yes stop_codon:yes gene_type:complete
MIGGRKVRSNKGKKRGSYRTRKTHHSIKVSINSTGTRRVSSRKVRSNKGKKRTPYGPRTGRTRSGRKFRGGGCSLNCEKITSEVGCETTTGKDQCKWSEDKCIPKESMDTCDWDPKDPVNKFCCKGLSKNFCGKACDWSSDADEDMKAQQEKANQRVANNSSKRTN